MSNLAEPGRLTLVATTGSNPGALRMLTYVPPGLPPGAPLVVVLHGCTQNAAAYDHGAGWSTLADRHGFALLFPEQERANNANFCFNWFQPGDVTRGEGEAAVDPPDDRPDACDTRPQPGACLRHRPVGRRRDDGGDAGAYPELFAGGAIIAGLPYGSAHGMHEAFEAMSQVRHRQRRGLGRPGPRRQPASRPLAARADLARRRGRHGPPRQRGRAAQAVVRRARRADSAP